MQISRLADLNSNSSPMFNDFFHHQKKNVTPADHQLYLPIFPSPNITQKNVVPSAQSQLMRLVEPRLKALRRIQVLAAEQRGVEPGDHFVEVLETGGGKGEAQEMQRM